ncbi:MAG: hypothetical protein J1E83_12745 [Lachnospiraceae bacterium]|nr:hypothetical protein [Lachnospiraceae bacterium]
MTREDILQIAKPILFNTDMTVAIWLNRKTATRRKAEFLKGKNPNWTGYIRDGLMLYNGTNEPCIKPPRYKVGDYLYVRETWCNANKPGCEPDYYYFADTRFCEDYDSTEWRWRPSIHMPKEAARIFLKVTDVRVERLQDITFEGCLNEGAFVYLLADGYFDRNVIEPEAKRKFGIIWDSTIPKNDLDKYGWAANPWIWVIEFERVEVQG